MSGMFVPPAVIENGDHEIADPMVAIAPFW